MNQDHTAKSQRDTYILLNEIEEHFTVAFGQDCTWGMTFIPGIQEYDIHVWYEVQYPETDFQPAKTELEARFGELLKNLRDINRVGRVSLRKANGATRADAVQNLWRQMFEAKGEY